MYKATEYPTIEFCKKNISYSETICEEIDQHFKYKKVRFSDLEIAESFRVALNSDAAPWNGVFLADVDIDGWNLTGHDLSNQWMVNAVAVWDADALFSQEIAREARLQTLTIDFELLDHSAIDLRDFLAALPRDVDVLVNPTFSHGAERVFDFVSALNEMYHVLATGPTNNLMLPASVMKRTALLKHPCNAYVCCGVHCHSQKSGKPRHLFVRPDRKIVPENGALNDKYVVYDLSHPTVPMTFNVEAMDLFTRDMKWLFKNFVVESEYELVPLAIILPYVPTLRACL